MSEPSEPLVVPDELAARVRAVGEERKTTTEETLAQLLALVLDVVEHPPRSGRWFLSIVDTDEGPTPPSGFEEIFDDYPRWSSIRLPSSKREPATTEGETQEGADADEASEKMPSCGLCLLRRDDDATALVEVLPTTNKAIVYVYHGDQHADEALSLHCHEAWIDLGSRVWHRVMQAADELADQLAASGEGETDEPPDSGPSS